MRWHLEDYTKATGGYITIFCDGERAADVFPFAKGVDESTARERARYMVAALNAADEVSIRAALARAESGQ